ncbi:MAG: AmmeMemoRadiSam system protein B [Phycisphaerae bacterium]
MDVQPSQAHPGSYDLRDASGIATSVFTLSPATLSVLVYMDGSHDRSTIQAHFYRRFGRMLYTEQLDQLIRQLDEARFLEGPGFDTHMEQLVADYRNKSNRPVRDVQSLGAPIHRLGDYFDELLVERNPNRKMDCDDLAQSTASPHNRVVGIVAPHLDYERGAPCYAAAYQDLVQRTTATRFVILGTNHFGQSRSVVGTRMDFDTPFGIVPHDGAFMRRLDERCGFDLCENELDHLAEHSIELQVILLKHLLGDRKVAIAPYLCPDPCGPSGTAPVNGNGVDLMVFAEALREEITADDRETCLIAGADLSHVGRYFMDDRDLNSEALAQVEASDRLALSHIEGDDPEGFRQVVADRDNDTHICSVGCIYALSRALDGQARPRLLHYHQAVTPEAQNCVTCAAMEFVKLEDQAR